MYTAWSQPVWGLWQFAPKKREEIKGWVMYAQFLSQNLKSGNSFCPWLCEKGLRKHSRKSIQKKRSSLWKLGMRRIHHLPKQFPNLSAICWQGDRAAVMLKNKSWVSIPHTEPQSSIQTQRWARAWVRKPEKRGPNGSSKLGMPRGHYLQLEMKIRDLRTFIPVKE